jgi:DNA-binding HxlR family transcriptional regulator
VSTKAGELHAKGASLGLDRDMMILAWVNRCPSGFARASDLVAQVAEASDLQSLERRGLISRVPPSEPDGEHGFVITPAGQAFQQGD